MATATMTLQKPARILPVSSSRCCVPCGPGIMGPLTGVRQELSHAGAMPLSADRVLTCGRGATPRPAEVKNGTQAPWADVENARRRVRARRHVARRRRFTRLGPGSGRGDVGHRLGQLTPDDRRCSHHERHGTADREDHDSRRRRSHPAGQHLRCRTARDRSRLHRAPRPRRLARSRVEPCGDVQRQPAGDHPRGRHDIERSRHPGRPRATGPRREPAHLGRWPATQPAHQRLRDVLPQRRRQRRCDVGRRRSALPVDHHRDVVVEGGRRADARVDGRHRRVRRLDHRRYLQHHRWSRPLGGCAVDAARPRSIGGPIAAGAARQRA